MAMNNQRTSVETPTNNRSNQVTDNDFNNIINMAIHEALVRNISYIRRDTIEYVRSNVVNSQRNSMRFFRQPPIGGVVDDNTEEQRTTPIPPRHTFLDDDDISSLIFLDATTRLASPDDGDNFDKRFRRHLIKKMGAYKKIKDDEPVVGEPCPICMEDFIGGEFKRTLHCLHTYHKRCIDKWIREDHDECPMCRKNVFNKPKEECLLIPDTVHSDTVHSDVIS